MLCVLTALHVFSQVIFGPMFSGKRWAFYPQAWKQHGSEITLLKCLFSAVYSSNTFSFFLVKFCRVFIIPPNSVLCISVYSMCTVCCMVADFILSQINLNLILTSDVNKHIVICVFCFCLSFNVPLLWHRVSRIMWQPAVICPFFMNKITQHYEQILMKLSGNVDNGVRNRWLHLCDVLGK